MSDLRVGGPGQGPMSLEPSSLEDESAPWCRDASALQSGQLGAGGTLGAGFADASLCRDASAARMGERGASGTGGTPGAMASGPAIACRDEIIHAVGTCGVAALSAGAVAILTGMMCLNNAYQAIECLAAADER